jgi:hypothetical protein
VESGAYRLFGGGLLGKFRPLRIRFMFVDYEEVVDREGSTNQSYHAPQQKNEDEGEEPHHLMEDLGCLCLARWWPLRG